MQAFSGIHRHASLCNIAYVLKWLGDFGYVTVSVVVAAFCDALCFIVLCLAVARNRVFCSQPTGYSPLMLATRYGHLAAVQRLIAYGADSTCVVCQLSSIE